MMTDADGCQGEDDDNEDSPAQAYEMLTHNEQSSPQQENLASPTELTFAATSRY